MGPFVIVRVCSVHAAIPVEAVAQHLKLRRKPGNVALRYVAGVHMVFDGIVFRRQAKGVETDGKKYVVALHAPFAGNNIHCGVGPRVAHMKPLPRRVGKFHQRKKLRTAVSGLSRVDLVLKPFFLPLLFNPNIIVCHVIFSLLNSIIRFGPLAGAGQG